MLDLVDEALEAMLRAGVPLSAQDVDVSFEPPDEEWSAKLTRPTVNLFLSDIVRSISRARSGSEVIERDGRLARRLALPRVELQYLCTVWTSDHGDERALVSGLMRTVLSYHEIPSTFVPEALHDLPAMTVSMASSESRSDQFTLRDRYKVGLRLVVTAAVETMAMAFAGPPTTGFELRVKDRVDGGWDVPLRRVAGEVADPAAVGKAVTSSRGRGTVNAAGRFLVPAQPGDEITLHTDPPRTAVVPDEGGVIFADSP